MSIVVHVSSAKVVYTERVGGSSPSPPTSIVVAAARRPVPQNRLTPVRDGLAPWSATSRPCSTRIGVWSWRTP